MEHSPISIERAQELIQVIELSGTIPLVRLSSNDPVQIKRVMDAGAYGVIVPNVRTAEDVSSAIRAAKYPPAGSRGVGLARAQGYGASFEDYRSKINKDGIVIVQIENKDAVEDIENILSVQGLNGVIIGPYDLSGSYGVTGQLTHPRVKAAEKTVLAAAKKAKIPCGTHIVFPDREELGRRIKLGYNLIAFGVDMIFVLKESKEAVDAMRSIKNKFR
jgi:2-dehydro-3-deoxyglucarate aldolase